MSFYETDQALAQYLLFHYGSAEELLPFDCGPSSGLGFPSRCVQCLDLDRLPSRAAALDLGCAVGGATFELARHCTEVVGVDYSQRFIAAARSLQEHGSLGFSYSEEGDICANTTARVPAEIDRRRVAFEQGDAQELRADLPAFDVVLMANLIDRLGDPRRCLRQLPRLLRPGGQLILTSPYTWMVEFTPKANWLGGFEREGRRVRTLDTLKEILSPHFDLTGCQNLPFLIREHGRKFQWSVAEASNWLRNDKTSS